MMFWDNVRIFVTLQNFYIFLAVAFFAISFVWSSEYSNLVSMIGFFSCIILLYLDKIYREVKYGS